MVTGDTHPRILKDSRRAHSRPAVAGSLTRTITAAAVARGDVVAVVAVGAWASGAAALIPPRAQSTHPSRCTGIVNVNVEPCPTWLWTRILPPWSSMNFRQRVRPSPVPSAFFSAVPTCRNSSLGFVNKLWQYRDGMTYLSPAPL